MLQHRQSTCDAERALLRNALALANGEINTQPKREVCMRCGQMRHVFSTIPIHCAGQGIEFAPLCGSCTREVSR